MTAPRRARAAYRTFLKKKRFSASDTTDDARPCARPRLPRGVPQRAAVYIMGRLAGVLMLLVVLGGNPAASSQKKTVMAWIEGNLSEVSHFVLHGAGKGAVNAVSHTSLFTLAANATAASLSINTVALAEHKVMWQQGTAKQLGIRTHPCIGYGGNITGLRTLFQPANQGRFITDLVAAIQASDVDVRSSPPPPAVAPREAESWHAPLTRVMHTHLFKILYRA